MNLIGTILVYAALAAMLLGGLSMICPLKFMGIVSRPRGIVVLLCGVVVFLMGLNCHTSVSLAQHSRYRTAYERERIWILSIRMTVDALIYLSSEFIGCLRFHTRLAPIV